jgi:hypothetical protein
VTEAFWSRMQVELPDRPPAACQGLRMPATSREPLSPAGEAQFPLAPAAHACPGSLDSSERAARPTKASTTSSTWIQSIKRVHAVVQRVA